MFAVVAAFAGLLCLSFAHYYCLNRSEVSSDRLVEIWVFVVVIVKLHIAGCVGKWASGEGCFLLLVVVLLQNYLHKIVLVLCSIL